MKPSHVLSLDFDSKVLRLHAKNKNVVDVPDVIRYCTTNSGYACAPFKNNELLVLCWQLVVPTLDHWPVCSESWMMSGAVESHGQE